MSRVQWHPEVGAVHVRMREEHAVLQPLWMELEHGSMMNNDITSKEGRVIGHVGNEEQNPFSWGLCGVSNCFKPATVRTGRDGDGMITPFCDTHAPLPGDPETDDKEDAQPALFEGSQLKFREGDQNLPSKNDQRDCQSTFLSRMNADVQVRREVGIQRYGTALQPFNKRDAMRDAWEEFIDLGQYMEQLRRERAAMIELLTRFTHVGGSDDEALVTYDRLSGDANTLLMSMGHDKH